MKIQRKAPKFELEYNPKMTIAEFQEENEAFFLLSFEEDNEWCNMNWGIPDRFYDYYLPEQEELTIEMMKDCYDEFLIENR